MERRQKPKKSHRTESSVAVTEAMQSSNSGEALSSVPDAGATSTDAFFRYLLGVSEYVFLSEYFERKPLHHQRGNMTFFQEHAPPMCAAPLSWSSKEMVGLCQAKALRYTTDINVVRYDAATKKRLPFQTDGVVRPDVLQSCFNEGGWSVRFLRPQEHSPSMSAMVGAMEAVFQCSSGVNSYWTPPKSQGFAPHYDDVDVYLLQLEGSKRWRLYHPPLESDLLSRHSSEDYLPEELGKPFMTMTLRAGDVLYMPRGTVHQGDTFATDPSEASLHVTFSAFQLHSMADLLLRITNFQIETLAANDVKWRRAIPRSWFRTMGAAYGRSFSEETGCTALAKADAEERSRNLKRVRSLVTELCDTLQAANTIDNGVDRYAIDVLAKCQPPSLPPRKATAEPPSTAPTEATRVALVSGHAVRLIMYVPGEAQVYHIGQNSPVCLATPIGNLRFDRDFAPAIAALLAAYPVPMRVDVLPMPAFEDAEDANENRLVLVGQLMEAGVLVAVD